MEVRSTTVGEISAGRVSGLESEIKTVLFCLSINHFPVFIFQIKSISFLVRIRKKLEAGGWFYFLFYYSIVPAS